MDPLSIVTAGLSIIASATTSAKTLLGIWKAFDPARDNTRGLCQDIETFHGLLAALQGWLADEMNADPTPGLLQTLESIKNPVDHCDGLMRRLVSKAQLHQVSSYSLRRRARWALVTKDDVNELTHWLQSAKSSLQIALVLYTTQRVSAISTNTGCFTQSSNWEGSVNFRNAVVEPFVTGVQKQAVSPGIRQNRYGYCDSFEDFKIQTIAQLRDLSLQQTQCQQQFVILRNELAGIAKLLEQGISSNTKIQSDDRSSASITVDDIFFDCVSRLSGNTSSGQSFESLSSFFGGSADYCFERNNTFYPELYSHGLSLQSRLYMEAMIETTDNNIHHIECLLRFASSPRHWHRIHLHAYIANGGPNARVIPSNTYNNTNVWSVFLIPTKLENALLAVIDDAELFEPVTSLRLTLAWESSKVLVHDPLRTRAAEDVQETALLHEELVLQRLQDLGCKRYCESEIVTHRRIKGSSFLVTVGEFSYVEVKARFVYGDQHSRNGFLEFVEQIMDFHRLGDCPGIPKLRGIILDDEYKHLKGYIRDGSVRSLVRYMNYTSSLGIQVPASLKVRWMRQLAENFAWLHDHGFILPPFRMSIDVDGNLMVHPWAWGDNKVIHSKSPSNDDLRHDIYRLGQLLWRISEEIENVRTTCDLAGCTVRPRYTCKIEHIHWDSLLFSAKTDPKMRTVIQQSLSMDPKTQPTAQEISHEIRKYAIKLSTESTVDDFLPTHIRSTLQSYEAFWINCNECNSTCASSCYHCSVCEGGDFDLCMSCVASGVHCWDPNHKMTILKINELGIMEEET